METDRQNTYYWGPQEFSFGSCYELDGIIFKYTCYIVLNSFTVYNYYSPYKFLFLDMRIAWWFLYYKKKLFTKLFLRNSLSITKWSNSNLRLISTSKVLGNPCFLKIKSGHWKSDVQMGFWQKYCLFFKKSSICLFILESLVFWNNKNRVIHTSCTNFETVLTTFVLENLILSNWILKCRFHVIMSW